MQSHAYWNCTQNCVYSFKTKTIRYYSNIDCLHKVHRLILYAFKNRIWQINIVYNYTFNNIISIINSILCTWKLTQWILGGSNYCDWKSCATHTGDISYSGWFRLLRFSRALECSSAKLNTIYLVQTNNKQVKHLDTSWVDTILRSLIGQKKVTTLIMCAEAYSHSQVPNLNVHSHTRMTLTCTPIKPVRSWSCPTVKSILCVTELQQTGNLQFISQW